MEECNTGPNQPRGVPSLRPTAGYQHPITTRSMTEINIPTAEAFKPLEPTLSLQRRLGWKRQRRYADHLKDAEFRLEIKPNQGAGAAAMRIEAVRRIFPRCRFDEKQCEAGIEALGFYHEKKDEQRSVGLGPSHDWSSHAADAFGLMALSYEDPQRVANFSKPIVFPKHGFA